MRIRDKKDTELLADLARGNDQALATLYERHAGAALSLATKICADRSLAEEVVQEAFLSVWRRPDGYRSGRGSVLSYILGAVHNKAVDVVRHEQALRRRERNTLNDRPESSEDVDESAWMSSRRSAVREALEKLSELQREALETAYFGGFTYREVALKLGIPVGTAKTRLRDGMIRLRSILRESGLVNE